MFSILVDHPVMAMGTSIDLAMMSRSILHGMTLIRAFQGKEPS
jgi:hypothetical protein